MKFRSAISTPNQLISLISVKCKGGHGKMAARRPAGDTLWTHFGPKVHFFWTFPGPVLGPFPDPFWDHFGTRFGTRFGPQTGPQTGPKMDPKGDQKWTQIWPPSGRPDAPKSNEFLMFLAIWPPLRGPISAPEMDPKWAQKWTHFCPLLGPLWGPFWPPFGTRFWPKTGPVLGPLFQTTAARANPLRPKQAILHLPFGEKSGPGRPYTRGRGSAGAGAAGRNRGRGKTYAVERRVAPSSHSNNVGSCHRCLHFIPDVLRVGEHSDKP